MMNFPFGPLFNPIPFYDKLKKQNPTKFNRREIIHNLQRDLNGELSAIEQYTANSLRARELGYDKVADALDHIRSEEEHHRDELLELIEKVSMGVIT